MINEIKNQAQIPFQALEVKTGAEDAQKLFASAKKFESFFVGHIFDQIQQNIPKEGIFGDSQAESVFQSMFMQQIGEQAGHAHKGLGLAEAMFRQMKPKGIEGTPISGIPTNIDAEKNSEVKTSSYIEVKV